MGDDEAPKASLPPPEVTRSNPAGPTTFDVVRECLRALLGRANCPRMIEWGKASEFVEKKFRRSKGLYAKRYYENGARRFRQYCEQKRITEVDEESVYGVLDGFVGWLDLQGIKPRP